jgi:FixJ family two-component response regulator
MDSRPTVVCVVDDDPSVRKGLARLLGSAGYQIRAFASAQDYLDSGESQGGGCLVLDLQLPGPSGLDLQEALARAGGAVPIVFITGHGDIPASVKAMKAGAVDFLQKPFEPEALLEAVRQALSRASEGAGTRERVRALQRRIERLSPRERQVFAFVARGWLNKQAAVELGITEKTIKVHRARVMQKLGAKSLADLVRIADRAGFGLPGEP